MTAVRDQRGSSLIMLIGIIAALAIMGASLVVLTGNVQSNTLTERTRAKSFSVAEAALDMEMYTLGQSWPVPVVGQTPHATIFNTTQFTDRFPANEFARPKTGSMVAVQVYDDQDWSGDGKIDAADGDYDRNANGLMYVEAQGKVGDRASRVVSKVERTFVDTSFPRGIAVYCGGEWSVSGGAGVIDVEDSGGYTVNAYAAGGIDKKANFDNVTKNEHTTKTLEEVVSQVFIQQIIVLAQSTPGSSNSGSRYYDCTSSNPKGADSQPADKNGICVIKVNNGDTVDLGNGNINSLASPGILFVLGGPDVGVGSIGGMNFYGVYYSDGQLGKSAGGQDFHGMCIAAKYIDTRGNTSVHYNDSCISKVAQRWTLTVKLVPNTWREIKPQ